MTTTQTAVANGHQDEFDQRAHAEEEAPVVALDPPGATEAPVTLASTIASLKAKAHAARESAEVYEAKAAKILQDSEHRLLSQLADVRALIGPVSEKPLPTRSALAQAVAPVLGEALAHTAAIETAGPKRSSKKTAKKDGRLARRTPEEIQDVVVRVSALLMKNKGGLRSEQIREAIQLDKREMPSVLKKGLETKVIRSKGEKRATTYFATGK